MKERHCASMLNYPKPNFGTIIARTARASNSRLRRSISIVSRRSCRTCDVTMKKIYILHFLCARARRHLGPCQNYRKVIELTLVGTHSVEDPFFFMRAERSMRWDLRALFFIFYAARGARSRVIKLVTAIAIVIISAGCSNCWLLGRGVGLFMRKFRGNEWWALERDMCENESAFLIATFL